MYEKTFIIIGILIPLCFAAGQNILYGNLAATLIPGSPNPTLGLQPLNINDPNQQWNILGGVIYSANPGYSNYVWDVKSESTTNGTRVILWSKKSGYNANEQWTVQTNGAIGSALAANYSAAPNGTTGIYMTYAYPPAAATIQPASTAPWHCSSIGDPHITPYPPGRNDLYSPGNQIPGTFTLSKTGVQGQSDYLLIQADQQQCLPISQGIYCNKRGVLKTQGHVIEINYDTVTVDGANVTVDGTYMVDNGVNITKYGTANYIVNYSNGYTKFYSPTTWYTNIYITVTSGPEPTGGLCTQYTGPNLNTTMCSLTPSLFCLSWRAPNLSDDLFAYSDELSWRAANPLNFTSSNGSYSTTNQTLYNAALNLCAPVAPNSSLSNQCTNFLPSADFYQACLYDVISTGDYGTSAPNVDAFASKCSSYATGSNATIVLPTSGANSVAFGPGIASNLSQSSIPISFNITARDVNGKPVTTGGDNFVVTISGRISFNLLYLGAGIYQVTFTPSAAGIIVISIELNGCTPILNSPFTVIVVSAATDPAQSTAVGQGVSSSIPTGTDVNFTVIARTASGAQRTTGGDKLAVKISGSAAFRSITDEQDGTYFVEYQQELADANFTVAVTINGGAIMGSPFTVYVNDD